MIHQHVRGINGRTMCASVLAVMLSACLVACRVPPLTAIPLTATAPVSGQITVFAAASLREAFQEIAENFQAQNPGASINFSFAGSQQLVEQISLGAPADVFASANTRLMDTAIQTGRVVSGTQYIFAHNRLIVVMPRDNPARIAMLSDLAKPGVKIVLADASVPVGAYSLDFLAKASARPEFGATYSATVIANVVSYEEDVRAVFGKVSLGEADAGIVYSSDIVADRAAAVHSIDIPDELNTIATYPIAPLADSANLPLAQRFVDYVLSAQGQQSLARNGFIRVE